MGKDGSRIRNLPVRTRRTVSGPVCENTVIGASALGAKGIKSESLGENCAAELRDAIGSGATVDDHMLDQILPYMALADGRSVVLADELTEHAKTNIWVIEKMLGRGVETIRLDELIEIVSG